MPDEMKHIVRCRHCSRVEYYGKMRYLNGRCECRSCYKHHYEEVNRSQYRWDDLDGPRPTELEFFEQEDAICEQCTRKDCNGCEHQH
jgi:hypothetical protein